MAYTHVTPVHAHAYCMFVVLIPKGHGRPGVVVPMGSIRLEYEEDFSNLNCILALII